MRPTRRPPLRPAFYARISEDRTGLSIGVKDQIEQGRKHFAAIGWPEPEIYFDNDLSAKSGKLRPDFERLLADIESGSIDGLGARHLDRLLRRAADLERVLDAVEIHRVPVPVALIEGSEIDLASASGRLLARILASVAANESEIKGERVGAARRREAQAGKAHGPLGYGFDADQVIVPAEAAIVREVAARVIDGQSLRSIAIDLNDRGVPTPGDGRWDSRRVQKVVLRGERVDLIALIEAARSDGPVPLAEFARLLNRAGASEKWTVRRVQAAAWAEHLVASGHGLDDSSVADVLRASGVPADRSQWRAANLRTMMRRGALCGWREFSPGGRGGGGELVAKGAWSPILAKEAVETIRKITNRPGVRGPEPKYLLAGILRCARCGSSMGGSPDGYGGTRYACSKQPGRGECGGVTITGHQTDSAVAAAVIDALADPGVRSGSKRKSKTNTEMATADEELAAVAELRDEYAREAAAGDITPREWRTLRDGLTSRQRKAERVLGAWAPAAQLILKEIPRDRAEIGEWWDEQALARRREVIKSVIDHVSVSPGKGARRFDATRLGEPVWLI